MKILHLSTYLSGGAANAAYRLHQGLLQKGVDSIFGVKAVTKPTEAIKIAADSRLKRIYADYAPRIEFHFAKWRRPAIRPVLPGGHFPGICRSLIKKIAPDVLNLHWVEHNFVSISDLKWIADQKIPLIWTLHDMAPLSGGFFYREEAGLPNTPYGPLACRDARKPVSEEIIQRRTIALQRSGVTVISPSRWLAEEARRSPVFKNHRVLHVPNGISTNDFSPLQTETARARLGLPVGRKIILFGATGFNHPRKGLQHLKKAIETVATTQVAHSEELPLLVCFGNEGEIRQEEFALPVIGLGSLANLEDLRAAYSAADLFICPSREDNLPNTILESLACGTPVFGFDVGGIPDFLGDTRWGSVSPRFDESHLAGEIYQWLKMPMNEYQSRRQEARAFATSHLTLLNQASRYKAIYEELMSGTVHSGRSA